MKNNLFWTGFFALVSVFRERKLPMAEKKKLAVTEEKVVEIEMERLRSFENHPSYLITTSSKETLLLNFS